MDESIDLVMSLTGAKYSRKAISQALEQCEGDADEAIEYLIQQSRTEMFSAKTIAKEPKIEIKQLKATKPEKLSAAENQL